MNQTMTETMTWDAPAEFVTHKANPTPDNAQVGYLKARDGALLRSAVFTPEKPRGTIVLMTGYSEYIEKYFETVSDLMALGYCVVLPEWRGHGLSEGDGKEPTRLHLTDFDINLRDLEDRWERLVAPMPKPHLGLAHSMGGQISLRAAQAHPEWFAALAQCAPMHGSALPTGLGLVLRLVMGLYRLVGKSDSWNPFLPPGVHPADAKTNRVTYDLKRFRRGEKLCVQEPRLQVNGASLGWMGAAFKAMKDSEKPAFLNTITTPLYIGTAEEELLVDNGAHAHVLKHVVNGQGDFYPKARHELMMEKNATRKAFLKNIEAFYQAQSSVS
jgi:lysophospholipase